VTSSTESECKIANADAAAISGHMSETTICELKSCLDTHFVQLPSKSTCEYGEWTNRLTCSPINATCKSANVPEVNNGNVECNTADKDEGTDNFLGGSQCKMTCDIGYLPVGTIQCINDPASEGKEGIWTVATCVKDERCTIEELPEVSDGKVKCNKFSKRLQPRVTYAEAGKVCQIECNPGYEVSGLSDITCKATIWEKTGICLTQRCLTSSRPVVPFGTVRCDADTVYRKGDTCDIICDDEYTHANSFTVATCGSFGTWEQSSKCVRHGNWGEWGPWSECTKTCKRGTKTRFRKCDNPPPDNGGNSCPVGFIGPSQRMTCNTQCCPIDASWTSWGSWSACSNDPYTCGPGTQRISRTCTGASCGGRTDCPFGSAIKDTRDCYIKQCCNGHDDCCNPGEFGNGQCGYGEGDCDNDSQCTTGYCEPNSCRRLGLGQFVGVDFDNSDDCCGIRPG